MANELVVRREPEAGLSPVEHAALAGAQLARIGRYLDVHARRAATAPLPPFEDDPVRQGDLVALGIGPQPVTVRLPAEDLARAQAVCRALWQRGADEPWLERWLLHLIGCGRDPASLGFWVEALDRRRPGLDAFASERRTYALAALASLAGTHGSAGETPAHTALRAAMRHPQPAVRAAAAAYLLRAYALAHQSAPAAALDLVMHMARDDEALAPRYFARVLLEAQRVPQGTEHPRGSITLACERIDAGETAALGEVELLSAHTLLHAHRALAQLCPGATASPFEFFLDGDFRGGRYELSASDGRGTAPGETALGDLGLREAHVVHYARAGSEPVILRLRVRALREHATPGTLLPRVQLARRGPAPLVRDPPSDLVVLRTHVNGTRHYDAPAVRGELVAGAALTLQREPTNAYDDRAIEVLTPTGQKLGYVPRARNRVLSQLMDAGEVPLARVELCEGRPEWPYVVVVVLAPEAPTRVRAHPDDSSAATGWPDRDASLVRGG